MDRGYDAGIRAAAADIAVHVLHDLLVTGLWKVLQQGHRGHNHSRSAVATLKGLFIKEGLLHRMQAAILAETFNSGDLFPGRR